GVAPLQPGEPAHTTAAAQTSIELKKKPSVTVILGQATGLRYRDPDALPLRIGTAILGSGFTGRLMSTVRDRDGLTYGIGASIGEDSLVDGQFAINATFAPQLLERGLGVTRAELAKWQGEGVTAKELADRKENLIGSFQVGLSNSNGLAGALL